MSRKTQEELAEMQRPVINKIDLLSDDEVLINNHEYRLIKNYRLAFDEELLARRFVPLLSRYDYIVGDIASGQLRLRGFYDDNNNVADELKISRLEDYLLEYCSFGCPYFVLQNLAVNEKAKRRWIREQKISNSHHKNYRRDRNKNKKTYHSVHNRKNEVVRVNKKKRQKTFTIREKR